MSEYSGFDDHFSLLIYYILLSILKKVAVMNERHSKSSADLESPRLSKDIRKWGT